MFLLFKIKPVKADVLLDYWSSDWGERKSQSYGKLCSQQQESLKYYKDEIKNNKRFNNLMQKLSGKVDIFDQLEDKIFLQKILQNCQLLKSAPPHQKT